MLNFIFFLLPSDFGSFSVWFNFYFFQENERFIKKLILTFQ